MWMDFTAKLKLFSQGEIPEPNFLKGKVKSGGFGMFNCPDCAGGAGGGAGGAGGAGGGAGGAGGDDDGEEVSGSMDAMKRKDGKWLIIKNWSECTKKCGGGQSVLERICIPAQHGGKPCYGPTSLNKACNTNPCPAEADAANPVLELPDKVEKTEIMMKQMSNRPNRYEECIVREGDLAVAREDLVGFPEIPRIPVRVVLNNKTIVIYDNDNYDSTTFAFSLHEVVVSDWKQDPKLCFQLNNPAANKKVALCVVESACKGDPHEAKEQWKEDIVHFATDCQVRYVVKLPARNSAEVKNEECKEEKALETNEENKTVKSNKMLDESVHETAKLAADAVDKELKAEELDEQEEKLRQKEAVEEMEKKVKEEKEKEKCIKKAIKRKSAAQQRKAHAIEVASKINEIKQSTIEEIESQQENHRKKMKKLRQSFERSKLNRQRELAEIKMTMTKDMIDAEKEGDATKCSPTTPVKARQNYCNEKFGEDWNQNKNCQDAAQFCEVCCEQEFGMMHNDMRDAC